MSGKQQTTMAVGDLSSNERGTGARANAGKVAFSLVPFHLLAGTARVFMSGKLKYAEWNWAKGMTWSTCVDCLIRHFVKWWYCGEDIDPESGEHHLDHLFCNLFMLKHYTETYKEGDDRPAEFAAFAEWLDDINTPFDIKDFLARNPAIAEKLEADNADAD